MTERKRVSVGEAKAHFSAIVDDVLHEDETYVIERRGKPVAVLISVEDLERLEEAAKNPPRGALALVGLWGDVGDEVIDEFLEHIYAERERDKGRPVDLGL
jgi:prevent-host-death family protein